MVNERLNLIKEKLLSREIKPIKIDSGSATTDPALWITDRIYIQVGKDYVVIFNNSNNGLSIHKASMRIKDIMDKLKIALSE